MTSYYTTGEAGACLLLNEEAVADTPPAGKRCLFAKATGIYTKDSLGVEVGPLSVGGGSLTLADVYPVGCIYTSTVSTNPSVVFGMGVWTAFGAGRVLVGLDALQSEFDTAEETGGAKTHTLTEAEMPAHTHVETNNSATTGPNVGWGARDTSTNSQTATGYSTESTGGGEAHNNLQPYIVVYFWKRTA